VSSWGRTRSTARVGNELPTPKVPLVCTSLNTQPGYTAWAASYDADVNLTRDLDRDVTARMLGGKRYAMMIEAACGSGKNTPFFARMSDSV